MKQFVSTVVGLFFLGWGFMMHFGGDDAKTTDAPKEVTKEITKTVETTMSSDKGNVEGIKLDADGTSITIQEFKDTTAVGLGDSCGGATGNDCHPDFYCQINAESKDLSGTCIDTVVDKKIECEKVNAPVCGVRDGHKFGYGSKCEAKRHGATVLYDGFCKKDKAAAGSCNAEVMGIGRCADFFTGVQYDSESNTCARVSTVACSADIPFVTEDECELACVTE